MVMKCFFNGCTNDATIDSVKCVFHMHRSQCRHAGCSNQVYARQLCVRHGGKRQCQVEGCGQNCRKGTFCTKHSPTHFLRYCSESGCQNQSHLRGRCFRHGGGRVCKVDGCETFARNRGFCQRHTPKTPPTPHGSTTATELWSPHSLPTLRQAFPLEDNYTTTFHTPYQSYTTYPFMEDGRIQLAPLLLHNTVS